MMSACLWSKNQYSHKNTSLKSFTKVGGTAGKVDVLGNS